MPSLKAIRNRIASIKNTRKITRAMKLVAAAKLRRAQDTIIAARPYSRALTSVVSELSGVAGKEAHARLRRLLEHAERTVDSFILVDGRRALPVPIQLGADVVSAQQIARIEAGERHGQNPGICKQQLLVSDQRGEGEHRQRQRGDDRDDDGSAHVSAPPVGRATPRVRRQPTAASTRQSTPPPIRPRPVAVRPPIASK